jgi:hypothetical protein
VTRRLLQCTANLEWYSPEVIMRLFISIITIALSIILLHTVILTLKHNIQSSRDQHPQDDVEAICYGSYVMQQCLAQYVLVEHLL